MTITPAPRARHYSRRLAQSFTLFVLSLVMALIVAGTGHSAQVSLAWDANTEPNLSGYKVYYGTASHVYDWVLDVGKVTTYTVTGLSDGLAYYFAATAYNTSNLESDYSGEVSQGTCTYSISPSSQSFTASGGTGTVSVTTQSTCPWTAVSGASWMTITSGSNGTGNGTVRYSMSANASPSSRTASSSMAGKVFTATQAGTSASTFTITASTGTGGSISPTGSVSVSNGTSKTFSITPGSGYRVASEIGRASCRERV
jgi:fibronectin type 3 domain-containing protein